MEKTTVYLTDDLKARAAAGRAIDGHAARRSSFARASACVTGTHRVAEPRLPLFESGKPDLAERVDELLDGFGER